MLSSEGMTHKRQVADESPPDSGGNMGGNAESEPSSLIGDEGFFISN